MTNNQKEAYVFVANGFEEIELVTIVDLLRRAAIPTKIVSVNLQKQLIGAHGITILSDTSIKEVDIDRAAALILPGGMPGAARLAECDRLSMLLTQAHERRLLIGAICAAPLVLGRINLLTNRKTTCYPGFEHELSGASMQSETTVLDDHIITSVGVMSAIEFSLALIAKILNNEVSDQIKRSIYVK